MKLFNILDTTLENFDNSIQTYLERSLGSLGVTVSQSSLYMVIFKGIKGVMQNLMFYFEDVLNEQNIYTATRKTSIYSLAKLSGYEPFYGSSASGTIVGQLQVSNKLSNNTTKIILYDNTKVINRNSNITYTIKLPKPKYVINLNKPLFMHEFNIVQGFYTRSTYVSEGRNLETIHITSTQLWDTSSIIVTVDGEEWQRVGTLYDMSENGKEYYVNVGFDNAFDVIFGNSNFGQRLRPNQVISVSYIQHSGILGNIGPNSNPNFEFASSGYDMYGNSINLNNYIKLLYKGTITGGINGDSIEFIRSNIGLNSRSNVLVSEDNFKLFLKRFSFIGLTNIYIDMNKMNIICVASRNMSELQNSSNYFTLNADSYVLNNEEEQMIKNTLYNSNKMFAGLTFEFVKPVFRKYCIMCYVKIEDTYNKELIKTQINDALKKYFITKLNNTQFISKSDVMKYILDNVDDIKSLSINFISDYYETAYHNKYYDKYNTQIINNNIYYNKEQVSLGSSETPGLDIMGNISLDSKLEFPIINGPITYYHNKEAQSDESITIQPVNIYFL